MLTLHLCPLSNPVSPIRREKSVQIYHFQPVDANVYRFFRRTRFFFLPAAAEAAGHKFPKAQKFHKLADKANEHF